MLAPGAGKDGVKAFDELSMQQGHGGRSMDEIDEIDDLLAADSQERGVRSNTVYQKYENLAVERGERSNTFGNFKIDSSVLNETHKENKRNDAQRVQSNSEVSLSNSASVLRGIEELVENAIKDQIESAGHQTKDSVKSEAHAERFSQSRHENQGMSR